MVEISLVRVNRDRCFFSIVAIVEKEREIAIVLHDTVHGTHLAAAFATLLAEKGHLSPFRISGIEVINLAEQRRDHQGVETYDSI